MQSGLSVEGCIRRFDSLELEGHLGRGKEDSPEEGNEGQANEMITTDQIVVHCVGDFWTQSDWMAQNKTKASFPAFCHALIYSAGFLLFSPSCKAMAVIFGTHFLIDRFRLARYIVWAKNFLAPRGSNPPFPECAATGYPPSTPVWLSVWLMIIADNILHWIINGAALKFL